MQTLADSFMNAPAGEKCPAPRYPSAGDIPLSIEAQVTMSREQQAALRIMLGGESMYFTGAGTSNESSGGGTGHNDVQGQTIADAPIVGLWYRQRGRESRCC